MKPFFERLGVIAWWVTLPALIVYLWNKPRTRVLVRAGGKILVVRGWLGTGKWMLPGGGLHKNEPALAGALREIREETGLALKAEDLRPLKQETYRSRGITFPCHYFVADLTGDPAQYPLHAQPMEISRVAWVSPEQLTQRTANPDVTIALSHAKYSRA